MKKMKIDYYNYKYHLYKESQSRLSVITVYDAVHGAYLLVVIDNKICFLASSNRKCIFMAILYSVI